MHALCLFIISLCLSFSAFAETSYEPLLNTVTMQLSAEQWITTKTALVTIGVNASVSGSGLEKTQNEVLTKLNKISNKGEWHLISFTRNLDQSGLERVQISAQARLPSGDLGGLRDRAKAISVPGETFTLDNVEFTPSADELREANITLRNNIYQQAKSELANLNKWYPDQKYYLHVINFLGVFTAPVQPSAKTMGVMAMARTADLTVGDKLNVTALAIFASAPNADVTKLLHN